ncbi:MAG: NADH-quinone oxidoreductase subunit NuoF [Gaiellaceae bacterium]
MALRELLLEHADDRDLTKLAEYEAVGGYASLRKAVTMERQAVLDELLAANVRGRGGAGFPMGRKASFLPQPGDTSNPIYLVANADESEPGTFKDREIMLRIPHMFVEGVAIAAYTIGASCAFIYLRGEYLTEFEVLTAALEEARKAGFVGKDVLGSGWGLTVVVHRGAGAYICGEETALLDSLEGQRGQPRTKPPFPAISGLYASPTLINNVETLATVPKILELGGSRYARLGVENSAGTRVFSLSGNVARGGNYELELGTTLRELVYDIGGGIPDGRELKAIIPGGSSVPVLGADEVDTPLDFDAMAEAGTMLGSGGVIVIDDRCCMVQLGLRVAQFYMHESCGKCTPCREGTRWMVQLLRKIEEGEASQGELDVLLNACDRILGNCLCPLGDAAAMPVASYVAKFREEYQRHIDEGGCPFGGESSLDRVLAPVDQHHAHVRGQIEVPGIRAGRESLTGAHG